MHFKRTDEHVTLHGNWCLQDVPMIRQEMTKLSLPNKEQLTVNGQGIEHIDTAGALLLSLWVDELEGKKDITLVSSSEQLSKMLQLVRKHRLQAPVEKKKESWHLRRWVEQLGRFTISELRQIMAFVGIIGVLSNRFYHACLNVKRFHFASIVSTVSSAGLKALPIIGLLSFLIGVVLAYQMGLQLQTYGANIYIAYLTGLSLQREFAPLMTAIIVAGRSSSAFTAQIGSMKVNQELDALHTMGLSPAEILVLPKVLAMLLIFPLMIFWSDIFGTLGAMVMAKGMLQISYTEFMHQLRESLGVKQLFIGLYKAPVFALLISLVGCFQGFQVKGSAVSVGQYTTKSVVQAIFLIIVTDACFSIVFSWLEI